MPPMTTPTVTEIRKPLAEQAGPDDFIASLPSTTTVPRSPK